jgi:hypothetical protein
MLMNKLRIYHPYGTVGDLDWMDGGNEKVAFGGSGIRRPNLLRLAGQIRTFTEQIHDEATVNAIRDEVESADVVAFLGFAFHVQNVDLITPADDSKIIRVFGTTKGISTGDRNIIVRQIRNLVAGSVDRNVDLRMDDLTCAELFDKYRRMLTADE